MNWNLSIVQFKQHNVQFGQAPSLLKIQLCSIQLNGELLCPLSIDDWHTVP